MTTARTLARVAGAVVRGTGVGAVGAAAAAGLIAGETLLAHARIPRAVDDPPASDGTTWCSPGVSRRRRPLHLAMLGDSTAAGFGVHGVDETLAAQLALRLSAASRRPVLVTNVAAVGARSADLHGQVDALGSRRPDVVVMMIGANDVTHRVRSSVATHHLGLAVDRLHTRGTSVVVGTCPDLGTVRPFVEPLRTLARRQSRHFAAEQARVVRRHGGRPVALHELLGPLFAADMALFSADRFHPSAAGYAAAARALLPACVASLGSPGTVAGVA